jgi:hypothetical protein
MPIKLQTVTAAKQTVPFFVFCLFFMKDNVFHIVKTIKDIMPITQCILIRSFMKQLSIYRTDYLLVRFIIPYSIPKVKDGG